MGIEVKDVTKVFGTDHTKALDGVTFNVSDGEFVSLTGRSGSGKSTLLYLMSSLDVPTSGTISISGMDLGKTHPRELHALRNQQIGFVFQFHYLLPELTALENVLMPAVKTKQQETKRSLGVELLSRFDLGSKLGRFPRQLSGGEQQRVAIARALIMRPKYLFADEPTGNLDSINGEKVMKIFGEVNEEFRTTIIFVTHEQSFAEYAQRQIQLADGRVIEDRGTLR